MLATRTQVGNVKEYIELGGIKYLIQWETDDRMVLTLPYGKIAYVAPVRNGEVVGLPITKGVLLSGDERYF